MNNRELHGGCSDQVSGTASGLPAGSDTTFRDAMMACVERKSGVGLQIRSQQPLRLIWH
jgi:hypothetical protein